MIQIPVWVMNTIDKDQLKGNSIPNCMSQRNHGKPHCHVRTFYWVTHDAIGIAFLGILGSTCDRVVSKLYSGNKAIFVLQYGDYCAILSSCFQIMIKGSLIIDNTWCTINNGGSSITLSEICFTIVRAVAIHFNR